MSGSLATNTSVRHLKHWIGGAATGDGAIERRSPATGELVAFYADGSAADVDHAVSSARATFASEHWRGLVHSDRASLLDRLATALKNVQPELAALDSEEVGKPLGFAMADIGLGIAHVEQAAAIARTATGESFPGIAAGYVALAERRPVGTAGLVVPWNFPGLIALQKLPYALAAGCTVVIKPSEFTSSSALKIAALCDEVGFPGGAVNVVTGYGSTVGQALVEHPGIDYVSFTGSTRTGRQVALAAAGRLTRVGLELGGNTANVVFGDADLSAAVTGTVFGAFANQGESCVASARLLVAREVAEEVTERLVAEVRKLRVGLPNDPATDLGSVIHHEHRDRVHDAVQRAVADGAHVATGGRAPTAADLQAGAFYEPTVLTDVAPTSAAFRDEIFGPVLTVTPFDHEDEAVELANATDYGLAMSLWTSDVDRAFRVGTQLEAGTVWVNTCSDGSPQLAFGGLKTSGYGRDAGREGYHEFTEYRTLQIRQAPRPSPFQHGTGS